MVSVASGVPSISSAQFSNQGDVIVVQFSESTDRANLTSAFTCSTLLDFVGANASTCAWRDSKALVVSLNFASVIVPEGTMTTPAAASSVRVGGASCSSCVAPASQTVTVSAAAAPVAPVVQLEAAQTLGICDDLSLDYSSSLGSGGRPWKRYEWAVDCNGTAAGLGEPGSPRAAWCVFGRD